MNEFKVVNADCKAEVKDHILVDLETGPITVTLPKGCHGDRIVIRDAKRICESTPLLIKTWEYPLLQRFCARLLGLHFKDKIHKLYEPLTVDLNGANVTLEYTDKEFGWSVEAT